MRLVGRCVGRGFGGWRLDLGEEEEEGGSFRIR